MIHTEHLEKVIALTLATGYLDKEKQVSLFIVSQRPESGKSALLEKFSETNGVRILSNATAAAIWRDYGADIGKGLIKHFLIPEFLAPMSRNTATTGAFLSTLQMMVEEGLVSFHSGFLKESVKFSEPRTVGVIACLPKVAFERSRLSWTVSGFLSRFMVVTYSYNQKTVEAIFESIVDAKYLKETKQSLQFPKEPVAITIDAEIGKLCQDLALGVTEMARNRKGLYGFRELKNVRRLVAGNVILENINKKEHRTEATMADFEVVKSISYLFNEEFNEVKK